MEGEFTTKSRNLPPSILIPRWEYEILVGSVYRIDRKIPPDSDSHIEWNLSTDPVALSDHIMRDLELSIKKKTIIPIFL